MRTLSQSLSLIEVMRALLSNVTHLGRWARPLGAVTPLWVASAIEVTGSPLSERCAPAQRRVEGQGSPGVAGHEALFLLRARWRGGALRMEQCHDQPEP